MTPAAAIDRLLCAPPCVGTAFFVYRLACGPLNNMTLAVATSRLLCALPCVGTAFCVYHFACGPLNNMTPTVAIDRLLCAPPCVGGLAWRRCRPADTAAEPNRRNLTGRAEPPLRVPPVHSVQLACHSNHVWGGFECRPRFFS